jgi:hypothetical protein
MAVRPEPFRPRFTLMLLYVAAFFFLYALLFALPDLLAGARALGPGPDELSPAELERAKEISRNAMSGGKVLIALAASVATVGLAAWRRALPGLR